MTDRKVSGAACGLREMRTNTTLRRLQSPKRPKGRRYAARLWPPHSSKWWTIGGASKATSRAAPRPSADLSSWAESQKMTAKAENSGKRWIAQEDERFRELAVSGANPSEIAAKLNRTEAATKARAYVLRVGLALPVEMGLKVKGK